MSIVKADLETSKMNLSLQSRMVNGFSSRMTDGTFAPFSFLRS